MKNKIKGITYTALFVAIIAVVSQIAIPTPSLVPLTLQTLIIPLCGYLMGWRIGLTSALVYIFLGAVGAPVFSSLQGGFSVIIGHGGGFILGFIPLVALCGAFRNKRLAIPMGCVGTLACHIIGTIWYMYLTGNTLITSFVTASLPYIFKDIAFCILAYFISIRLRSKMEI